jgi:serine/threonine-protein kinase
MVCIAASVALCLVLAGCGLATPNIVGQRLEQAVSKLQTAGLALGSVSYDATSQEPTGVIISQEPAAGVSARSGSRVSVRIAGPAPVSVPDVAGLDADAATAALNTVGLVLGTATESYDESISAGAVTAQKPVPGATVDRGSLVNIVVSRGRRPIRVPDVAGRPKEEAASVLKGMGLGVKVTETNSASKKGTVVRQKPAGGMDCQPGTIVTLVVSTGVDLVPVPSWRDFKSSYTGDDWGKTLESLTSAIKAGFKRAGLSASVEYLNAWVDGDTAHQRPRAGSRVPRGTRVRIQIPVYD